MIAIICISVFSIQLLVASILQIARSKKNRVKNNIPVGEISFLIPFHNEKERIGKLIQSINKSVYTGKCEFIFIDDHSTDATKELLNKELKIPFIYLQNTNKKGKKWAIKTGVKAAKYKFVITLDADVYFDKDYINNVLQLPVGNSEYASLVILPVTINSSTFIGKLACIEFNFLETLGLGLGKINQPILCYGANLGFSKASFLDLDATRNDYDIASGDDLFLLNAMQKQGKNTVTYSDAIYAVNTEPPSSFKANIIQRQRWFGKMGDLFNAFSLVSLLLLALVQIAGITALFLSFYNPVFLVILGIKYLAEIITVWQFIKLNYLHFFILLVHQIYYPFYILALLFPFSTDKKWR